jgi:RNA polymerase sigma factor (TIGR02999 family)
VPSEVTDLLQAHGKGEADAFERLVPLVYDDLRRVARSQLRRLRVGETLDTTGLVHEAYLRLVDQTKATWHDRGHFLAVSAVAMRQVLIDHARRKSRAKRGGDLEQATFDEGATAAAADAERLLEIDLALRKLGEHDPRLVRVVECRYFAGLSEHETAEAMGVSLRTAQREWLKARAWLRHELGR